MQDQIDKLLTLPLTEIERALIQAISERPVRHRCQMCARIIDALWRKYELHNREAAA